MMIFTTDNQNGQCVFTSCSLHLMHFDFCPKIADDQLVKG